MPSNGFLTIGTSEAIGSESSHTQTALDPKRPKRGAQSAPAPRLDSGQRLVIQQDEETGACVYTVTDRDTGEVIARLSREDVAEMGGRAGYAAGALIKAKA